MICTLIGREVNYKKYPCLKEDYENCPIYQEHERREEGSKVILPSVEENESSDVLENMINETVKRSRKFYDPKKGERPPTCYDCLYFSPTTKYCLLLRRKIKRPEEPECYR